MIFFSATKKAFTIPELLVTMTIIAILSTIGFLSYTNYASDSRDTVRTTDIKNITHILSLHKTRSATYPSPTNGVDITYSGATVWTQGVFGSDTIRETGKIFGDLQDPKYKNQYTYSVTANKKEYQIGVLFENKGEKSSLFSYNTPFSSPFALETAYAADPFSPLELNPSIWLDAQDIDGDGDIADNPANNTTVSSWVNKSSAGSTNNPVITAGTLKYATAGFNSNQKSVFIPATAGLRLTNSAITQGDIFYVVQKRNPFATTDSNGVGLQSSTTLNYYIGYASNKRDALYIGGTPNLGGGTNSNTNPYIYSFHKDTSYSFRDRGRIVGGPGTSNSIAGQTWAFNLAGATNQAADLVVSEILIFNQKLSGANVEKVEGYLAHKWGQQAALPAAHTYKAAPPVASGPPIPPDSDPDSFIFSDVSNALTSTLYTSNTITVGGINTVIPVQITGGEYSKNGTTFTSNSGSVSVGDTLQVRLTSSAANSTASTVTLTVGSVSESYVVTTLVADTTPDAFSFSSIVDANLNSTYTSNSVTISGLNVSVPISIVGTGALYKVSDGIPTDATSSGTPTASSSDGGDTPAQAFDNNTSSLGWANTNILPAWLKYDFGVGSAEKITKYTLYRSSAQSGFNTNNSSPKNWTFEGSDDNVIWTVLDTRTNQNIASDSTKQEFTFLNNEYYRYYRINISAVNHASQKWVNITEMELINEGAGTFTSNPSNVSNGNVVSIRMPAASTPETLRVATLNVGATQQSFNITTLQADTTPDNFAFAGVTGASLATAYTSNSITISGINTSTAISISGDGMYKVNAGVFTNSSSTVQNGDVIQIQQHSSASNSQTTSSTLTIGGIQATYNVTTPAPPPDPNPDPIVFADVSNAALTTVYTSEAIVLSGMNTTGILTVSGNGAKYDKNGSKNYVNTSTTVQNGDVITLQGTSSATPGQNTLITLNVGTTTGTFKITTVPVDTTPDPFTLSAVTDAELTKDYTSNPIIVSGINVGVPINVSGPGGGKYSINGGAWTNQAGTVYVGDEVRIKLQSLASGNSNVYAILNVNGVTARFDVTSLTPDTSVDPFVFQSIFDANLSSPYISDAISISGINTAVPISIVNGEYRIGTTGAFTSLPGTIPPGQTVSVRLTSSIGGGIKKSATLTVSGYSTNYEVTTRSLVSQNASQVLPQSNVYVVGNYNGLFVHAKQGDTHYVIASPSIISYDTSNTDILHIISEKKFVYNGFGNIPSSYSGSNLTMSGGFDFIITAPLLYEGDRKDLGSYGGMKQIDDGLKTTYNMFPAYANIASYMDDYTLGYLETILGGVIGINPIKPFYCSDILQSKLVHNIAPDAQISASPSLPGTFGTGAIANGKKETTGNLDYEYHSNDGNAALFFEWPTAQKIGYIKIYNRTAAFSERLSGANIKLYNEAGEVIYSYPLWNTQSDYVIDVDLEGIGQSQYAKKLSLESVNGNQLNLREVEIYLGGKLLDGVYKVDKDGLGGQSPYNVYCDMTTDGGGWTRIGEDYIHNGDFGSQNHVYEHTFQGYNDINDNLIVAHATVAPPTSTPDAFVLQKNGSSSEPYQLFFPDIPGEYFAQEIRLSAWVKGTTASIFHNTLDYTSRLSTTQPEYEILQSDSGWQYQMVRIPLTGLVKDFTWDVGKNISGPFYFTGLKMEVYYR